MKTFLLFGNMAELYKQKYETIQFPNFAANGIYTQTLKNVLEYILSNVFSLVIQEYLNNLKFNRITGDTESLNVCGKQHQI